MTVSRARAVSNDPKLIWGKYKSLTIAEHFAAPYGLRPAWARQTEEGNAVLALTSALSNGAPSNLLVVRPDLHHQYLRELGRGEFAPCDDNKIDAEIVIGCESYLSGLALAERWKGYPVHVVACFEPENIMPVLTSLFVKWPYVDFVSAPDTRDRSLCDGVIYPPHGLTWLDLQVWEVNNRWAA